MRRAAFALFLLAGACALGAGACAPDFADRESLVTRTMVLAVRAEPAEARPGEASQYSVLVATPSGPIATPIASWAYCATPKLLTENGAVSAACLTTGVRPIAEGPATVSATMPSDACAIFGPEVASADLRPRDPDVTGGFYQPVRVTVFGPDSAPVAFGLQRIACKLANASALATTDFARRYVPNENPELGPLEATVAGAPVALDAIPRGARVTLRASWSESAAERYVVYDLASRTVVEHREAMRVSWFATAGTFQSDRTGRAEEELATFTDDEWTAPSEARTTHLFVVLRDARGGVAYAAHELVTR